MSHEPLLPLFLKLAGRRVVLVGGGAMAAQRLPALVRARARIVVIAPQIRPELRVAGVTVHQRAYRPGDLEGAWLVVSTAPPEVNRQVAIEAEKRRVFVNAIDDRAQASAYAAGVVERDGVVLAVSTSGRAPALAGLLREALGSLLPDDLEDWVQVAEELRVHQREAGVPFAARRPALLQALNALYADRDEEKSA